jgi:hypothetical protein
VHASHLHKLDEGESLASYPGHFTPQRKIPGCLLNKRSWVGSIAGVGNPIIILVELPRSCADFMGTIIVIVITMLCRYASLFAQ